MRILVADDDPIQRSILTELLEGWGHEVRAVVNGRLAWEALQADDAISLLISDWLMPELDGDELCRRLRGAERERYLPIILLTSRDRPEDLVAGLNAGADAFVSKPLDEAQLLAQIRVAERTLHLEERLERRLHDLTRANARLERDLEAAAVVQAALLPDDSPVIPGVRFSWVYEACEMLGGDMFNVFRLDESRVGLYVLDVSGHGTPAALRSVSLSHALTPFDQQGGILKRIDTSRCAYEIVTPSEVAAELNRRFPLIEQSGQYFTFLYGVLDVSRGTFRYVRAGHPGPVVVRAGSATSVESSGGIPIGIDPEVEFPEHELQLDSGDMLLLYTDGVSEAVDVEGDEFGVGRLLGALTEAEASGVEARVSHLRTALAEWGKGARQRDDITLFGFQLD